MYYYTDDEVVAPERYEIRYSLSNCSYKRNDPPPPELGIFSELHKKPDIASQIKKTQDIVYLCTKRVRIKRKKVPERTMPNKEYKLIVYLLTWLTPAFQEDFWVLCSIISARLALKTSSLPSC